MSIISTLHFLWRLAPSTSQLKAVEAIGEAAKTFIQALEEHLPEAAGKTAAIKTANEAVIAANLALAVKLQADEAASASST